MRGEHGISGIIFHICYLLSIFCSFLIVNAYDQEPQNSLDLGEFILKSANANYFDLIENQRSKFCFDCMLVHKHQMYHCKKGGNCILGYQKYSQLFGKSIGAHNYLIYYINCIFALIISLIWFRQSIWSMVNRMEVDTQNSYLLFWLDGSAKLFTFSKVLSTF